MRSGVIGTPRDTLSTLDAAIGRRRVPIAQTEQRWESGHWLLSPIVPKNELIEVDLES